MKSAIVYWILIALLGLAHLQLLFLNFSWNIPIYLTCIIVIGVVIYFYKRILLRISSLGVRMNSLLFFMQLLLLLFYLPIKSSWVAIVSFMLFISLESIRLNWSERISSFDQDVKRLEEQSAHFNEVFRVVRSERHDFLKHVSAVHFMLENEKSLEAKAYLDQLIDGYEETNLSIKGERGSVAGVLHQIYRRGKAAGISVVYDLDLPLSTLPLSDKDLVTLLGNLLTNSVEASEEWQKINKEQAQISLQFYKRSGLFLLICKNNSVPIPGNILDRLFNSYGNTTKNDHEGLGTKIIHDIINHHQGFLDFVYKSEEFTVKIKIPAIGA